MRITTCISIALFTSIACAASGCAVDSLPDEPFEHTDLPIPAEAQAEAQIDDVSLAISAQATPVLITPVVFVPGDQSYPSGQIGAIDTALNDIQVWYRTRLGNGRLRFDTRRTVYGSLTAAQYLTNNTIWSHGPAEIQNALGFSPWTPGHIVLLMGVGLQGWAGGSGTGTSGYAVVGLESLINNPACAGNWWCTPTMWRGTAIHELGHALTLPHSAAPSIMAWHGDYQDKMLLNTGAWPEQNTIRSYGFFALTLGAGQSNWTSCSSDAQCSTMRCGCNGGTQRVCLPTDDYPEYCTFSNWTPCNEDMECQSGWCGCNGGTQRVCLPSTAYPKYCTFPNWTACVSDSDCASNRCGCNGGTQRVCLPSTAYPKYCTFPNYALCQGDADCASSWCGCNGGDVKMCLPNSSYTKTCQ
jgi:hypothetical protein